MKDWDAYYEAGYGPDEPSAFARAVEKMLPAKSTVLDVGAGNGRDMRHFRDCGHRAYGVDSAALRGHTVARFDAGRYLAAFVHWDAIYMRWFLHAVEPWEADQALKLAVTSLNPGGVIAIEARSANGEHPDDHMRWPVDPDVLQERLERLGLTVESLSESRDYSPMGDDRPLLVRCIARLEIKDSRRGADDAAPVLGRVAGDGPPVSEAGSWSC